MKKLLTVFSLAAMLACSMPVSAMEHGAEPDRYPQQPRHEQVAVEHPHQQSIRRLPPKEIHHCRSHKTGAVVGGIIAGAALAGIITTIAD